MSDEKKIPERDWVKEPYYTRDTLGDMAALEKRLARIELMLKSLLPATKRHDPEALAAALNEVAQRYGYQATGWDVQFDGTLRMGGFYKDTK